MKVKMMMTAVLCCVMTFTTANAQSKSEEILKEAERLAKMADENPNDGKMQYRAATGFIQNELGEKRDLDRSLMYALRALKIAEEAPALKDTLMGLTCLHLGMTYMQKNDMEKCFEYLERATDAFEQELGRHDPVTNGSKLVYSGFILGAQPFRAFPKILEAFYDNNFAPKDKQITNMEEATIMEELTIEMLISQYTQRYRYALPTVWYEGKQYLIVQTADWCVEKPLVGWMVPNMMRSEEERKNHKGDDVILADDKFQFKVLGEQEKKNLNFTYNFKHFLNNPRQLETNPGEARIVFFNNPAQYNDLVAKFREFKAKNK